MNESKQSNLEDKPGTDTASQRNKADQIRSSSKARADKKRMFDGYFDSTVAAAIALLLGNTVGRSGPYLHVT